MANNRTRLIAGALFAFALLPATGQSKRNKQSQAAPATNAAPKPEAIDLEFITRLRQEEFYHGKVMDIMSSLTDAIGPRLTGSPNMKRANEWTRDELAHYGLVNSHVEPWGTFGRGWQYQFASVRMTAPDYMQFIAMPEAWTPGTNGALKGEPVHVVINTPEDIEKYRGKLGGKIVMLGDSRIPPPLEKPQFQRLTKEELEKESQYEIPGGANPRFDPATFARRFALQQQITKFFAEEKVAAVLKPTREPGQDGTIFVQSGGPFQLDQPASTVPSLVLAIEHFGRVVRLLDQKKPVEVEVNVQANLIEDGDHQGYDTVAEIPGTDPNLKDQLVMLGGHMDSWHAGEGATDNAAGVSVAMEAVRLLKQLGVQPRRTIRIALWSGEEEGLCGSRGYVFNHFGGRGSEAPKCGARTMPGQRQPQQPLTLKPEQKLVSAYFNLDNGTGRVRGVYLQENEFVRPIFEKWMEPFHDLGMTTLSPANTGGTDHLSFDAVGIPGFQFIQDPMDYDTLTHHSNLDVYEHIRPEDMKQAAVIMASFVYNAAQRDDMMPRKPIRPDEPPAPSTPESESGREKKGEPVPPPSNPGNPTQPQPQPQQQNPR
ncbi:MAG: M20/M25/M40 family metallo-hydrolase [Acidobacteriales bacterium]|nr:M20/M25/M40 family metallo-hydrolase [Terriglobales bacterium]